ncbi:MAG: hypothetical protein FJ308_02615 [Planctomycetes bacterium]|nr:hypothetical protein [Planctomycetota bacterium]
MHLPKSWSDIDGLGKLSIAVLFLSGLIHVPIFAFSELPWDDPRSFRKPILFGLSTSVTLWSLLIVLHAFKPHRTDIGLGQILSISLVIEVALISLQPWRGQASHFNQTGILNQTIETGMLFCIVIASTLIFIWTARCMRRDEFPVLSPEMQLALRAGMVFLSISCVLGFAISGIGQWLAANGNPPGLFAPRGVLKFPHGSTLHAIQTLALLAWVCQILKIPGSVRVIWFAILAHAFWLAYSLIQTFRGRDRAELDAFGIALIGLTIVASVFVAIPLAQGIRFALLQRSPRA